MLGPVAHSLSHSCMCSILSLMSRLFMAFYWSQKCHRTFQFSLSGIKTIRTHNQVVRTKYTGNNLSIFSSSRCVKVSRSNILLQRFWGLSVVAVLAWFLFIHGSVLMRQSKQEPTQSVWCLTIYVYYVALCLHSKKVFAVNMSFSVCYCVLHSSLNINGCLICLISLTFYPFLIFPPISFTLSVCRAPFTFSTVIWAAWCTA